MPFVLKNTDGQYLKGRNAWNFEYTPDLGKARVYTRRGDASLSKNQKTKYGSRTNAEHLEVVEVRIEEVAA